MFQLGKIMNTVERQIAGPVIAALKTGAVDDATLEKINAILDDNEVSAGGNEETILPGNYKFIVTGPSFSIQKGESSITTDMARVDMTNPGALKRDFNEIYKFTGKLADADQIDKFVSINEKLTQALIGLRQRGKRGMFDEELYQKIQSTAAHITDRYFSLPKYFEVMGALAKAQGSRAKVYHWVASAWNMSYQEND